MVFVSLSNPNAELSTVQSLRPGRSSAIHHQLGRKPHRRSGRERRKTSRSRRLRAFGFTDGTTVIAVGGPQLAVIGFAAFGVNPATGRLECDISATLPLNGDPAAPMNLRSASDRFRHVFVYHRKYLHVRRRHALYRSRRRARPSKPQPVFCRRVHVAHRRRCHLFSELRDVQWVPQETCYPRKSTRTVRSPRRRIAVQNRRHESIPDDH